MTEDEARAWIVARYGEDRTARLAQFLAMVVDENVVQNLIAPSTVDGIWARHAMDSAQLVPLATPGLWIDIGTGGGFPGMVAAILREGPVVLVEPRKRRAAFLAQCSTRLRLDHVEVAATSIEKIDRKGDTISARAVASMEKLLQIAAGCAKRDSRWLLPRGRLTEADVAELGLRWSGVFHVEQSLTDSASSILVIDGLGTR